MEDSDVKRVFKENIILFLLLPVLAFFFTIFYTFFSMIPIYFVIIFSFAISFTLSFLIGYIRKNTSLCENINYITPLMGLLLYYEFFSTRTIDIIYLLIFSIFYYSFWSNFILSKILKNQIASYSSQFFNFSNADKNMGDILKNRFLELIEHSQNDLGDIYETYIENSIVRIFVEKNKKFLSIFCFEIFDNKILKTFETESIIENFNKIFEKWSEKKQIDKKIINKVFEPYILKITISKKIIASISFSVLIIIIFGLEASNIKNFVLENKKEVLIAAFVSFLTFLFTIISRFFGGRKK